MNDPQANNQAEQSPVDLKKMEAEIRMAKDVAHRRDMDVIAGCAVVATVTLIGVVANGLMNQRKAKAAAAMSYSD